MGHFDLYGNSYRTELEAMNAESAQCAEIDARIAQRNADKAIHEQQRSEYYLYERMNYLEERIAALEKKLNSEQNDERSVATDDAQ